MRKALFILLALVLLAAPALAVPGPEEPWTHNAFINNGRIMRMDFIKERGDQHIVFSSVRFPERPLGEDGWDFGGRGSYNCAFIELVDGGATTSLGDDTVVARVVGEYYDEGGGDPLDGLYTFMDTPWFGAGNEAEFCSAIGTTFGQNGAVAASAEEESRSFGGPGEPSHAAGHILQIWQDGVEIGRVQVPHGEVEYIHPTGDPGRGETSWWFRGDEDGEITLWYENPDTLQYGIIGRLSVVGMAPGITFDDCVIGNPGGTPCPQAYPNEPAPEPDPTSVELTSGDSVLTCPDGTTPAVESTEPLIVNCA